MTHEVKNSLVSLVDALVSESPEFKHYRCRVDAYGDNSFAVVIRFEYLFQIGDFIRLYKFIKDYDLTAFIGVGFIDIQ